MNLNKFFVIGLVILLVYLTPLFPLHEADGSIREDIKKLEDQIKSIKLDIIRYTDEVEGYKTKLLEADTHHKNTDRAERDAKNTYDITQNDLNLSVLITAIRTNSDAYKNFIAAQKNLNENKKILFSAQSRLGDLELKLKNLKIYEDFNFLPKRNGNKIGIDLSKTCIILLKNNFTTNCPKIEELLMVFKDTSNQKISGEFIMKDGLLQRANPHVNNHYNYYKYLEEQMLWIDPPSDILEKLRMITISPDIKEYFNRLDTTIINNTIYTYDTRIVSTDCSVAIIDSDQWATTLGDTIYYMQNNCNESFTNIDNKIVNQRKSMLHDITTSYKYQLELWMKNAKEQSKNTFLINPNKTISTNEVR